MPDYEIAYMSNPQLEEEALDELNASLDSKISELTGAISYSSPNIHRRLSYPIQGKGTAFLRTMQVELPPEHLATLKQFLAKEPHVLRSSIIKTHRREEIPADKLEQYIQKRSGKQPAKPTKPAKPAKKVTMKEVEKGIEEALHEEVK